MKPQLTEYAKRLIAKSELPATYKWQAGATAIPASPKPIEVFHKIKPVQR